MSCRPTSSVNVTRSIRAFDGLTKPRALHIIMTGILGSTPNSDFASQTNNAGTNLPDQIMAAEDKGGVGVKLPLRETLALPPISRMWLPKTSKSKFKRENRKRRYSTTAKLEEPDFPVVRAGKYFEATFSVVCIHSG